MTTEQPGGIRLIELLSHHLNTILEKERDNHTHIHLYDIGEFWIAFEQSAFQLTRLTKESTIVPLRLMSYPFPIITAAISINTLATLSHTHTVENSLHDARSIVTCELQEERYRRWHRTKCWGVRR